MAIASTTVFEVRTTGSDSNGGGFDPALGGTDYSQRDSPQATGTVTSSGTTVTATTSIFTSAMVGNLITDGTTWKEITAYSSGTVVTVDSAPSWTAASIKVGGALGSPGMASGLMVGGNQMWIQGGTYPITSATANVAGGCLSLPAGASASAATKVSGYQSTRGDFGVKPLLQASGISSFSLITQANKTHIENLSVDGSSLTSSRGINAAFNCQVFFCKALNCTNSGITGGGGAIILCEVTGCSVQVGILTSVATFGCVSHDNTSGGFSGTSNSTCILCVSYNNTSMSDGFNMAGSTGSSSVNCLAYNNGRDGFRYNAGSTETFVSINCRAEKNAGYGFNTTALEALAYLYNCSGWSNTSGNVNTTNIHAANIINFINLSGDPSNDAAGLDFSLNNLAGAGALLRAAGIPTASGLFALPGLSTPSYPDIGPAQHIDLFGYSRSRVVSGA